MKIYSIKDNEVGTYHKPFPEENDVIATRAVKAAMKTGFLQEYPSAFAMYAIGTFDAETGKIIANEPQLIVELSSLEVLDKGTEKSDN